MSRTKLVIILLVAVLVVGGGAMLVVGLVRGDEAEHIDVPPERSE